MNRITGHLHSYKKIIPTFVDELPEGDRAVNVRDGYLFYDAASDVFAGNSAGWGVRIRETIPLNGVHVPAKGTSDRDIRFTPTQVEDRFDEGNEIMLVPCVSHEMWVGDKLFVYQKLDWVWAAAIKSTSGKLKVIQWI